MAESDPTGRGLVRTSTPGVYKRGGGYVVRYLDPNGHQRQRAARTLAEARKLKAALTADVARGEHRELSRVSFADYATTWATTYTGRTGSGIRSTTLNEYLADLSRAVEFFGRRRLSEIEPQDVKRYARHLADSGRTPRRRRSTSGEVKEAPKGLGPATVRNLLAPVRALFATAVEEGLIRSNPASGLRLAGAKHDPAKAKALTPEELGALIEATPAGVERLLVRFVAATGLRIGEVVALRWEHLDFERGRVLVRERRYRETVDVPKSRFGRRDVPIGRELAGELRRHRLASRYSTDTDPVFATLTGTPHRPENLLRRVLKPAAAKAGVPWAGWHTLRHTCASSLFRSGANAKQVQVWLGHHSPAFTLATYVHLIADDLPDGAVMDALVGLA